jgi:sterol desaturase/sphingolipid hydroxylase (fatty acid hydroxylase superfamily)
VKGFNFILPAFFLFLVFTESFFPLRKSSLPRLPRILRNLSLALVGFTVIKLAFLPFLLSFSDLVLEKKWGLLNQFELTYWPKIILSVILMDMTLYFWHLGNHKISFLWRFHLVHHTDLEMDASTATRFHFGELVLSVFFRALQVLVFGIDPTSLLIFETSVTFFALFHHSNIRLPIAFERILNKVLVTPRMHTIHHSLVLEETDSNFSTIFSFWDRPIKTLRLNIPQNQIKIGVPNYQEPDQVTFLNLLGMPFKRLKRWALKNGEVPSRKPSDLPLSHLQD